jgi:hypothetical protein
MPSSSNIHASTGISGYSCSILIAADGRRGVPHQCSFRVSDPHSAPTFNYIIHGSYILQCYHRGTYRCRNVNRLCGQACKGRLCWQSSRLSQAPLRGRDCEADPKHVISRRQYDRCDEAKNNGFSCEDAQPAKGENGEDIMTGTSKRPGKCPSCLS